MLDNPASTSESRSTATLVIEFQPSFGLRWEIVQPSRTVIDANGETKQFPAGPIAFQGVSVGTPPAAPTTSTRSESSNVIAAPVLVIIGAIVVVFVLMYLVRVARENAQVSLTPGGKRKPRLVNGRRASAWEEAGRRTKVDSPEGTPREPGLGGVRGEGMFDDNDDEDNPDRPMSGDSPRGER